ncbi:MAG TPA: hypothetical protein VEA40_17340, partial [Ramlibacter sp.]|nr:hypothetical protein [Ramlibacter sp.]
DLDEREERDDDRVPRNVDPLRTSLPTRRDMTGVKRVNNGNQPDPTRTSIDSMAGGNRRGGGGGGGGRQNRGGGGGGYGQRDQRQRTYGGR